MKRFITAALMAAVMAAGTLTCGQARAEDDVQPMPTKGWTIIADEPAPPELTPEDYFRKGEESYEFGEYDTARENYEQALDGLTDVPTRAKCFERLAFVYAAFGMNDEVYDAFAESLKLDSSLALDPDIVSPKVYEYYVRARNDVVREGILVVNSDPPGASVYLDGVEVGEAPVTVEHVKEGGYNLVVKKRGYETSSGPVSIKKDITLTVDEKLVHARGALTVTSTPPGIAVSLDGKPSGHTPAVLQGVSGGRHTLRLTRQNFEDYEAEVSLDKGEEAPHHAVMKRRLLVILVDTVDAGAARKLIEQGLSRVPGLVPVYKGMAEVCAELESRGLSSESMGFAGQCKRSLELGETAVISGIMENARTELALVVSHKPAVMEDGSGAETLQLALYSAASELADVFSATSPVRDGLSSCVDVFHEAWTNATASEENTLGMATLDRADGKVEVISVLSGYPASKAGVQPGMVVKSLDGTPVSGTRALMDMTSDGKPHEYEFSGMKPSKVRLEPVRAYTEAPLNSGEYLYNLALVDLSAYVDAAVEDVDEAAASPAEAGTTVIGFGYAALGLGNVYRHFGMTDKSIEAYGHASLEGESGVCHGTTLYRLAEAYEAKGLWPEAASAYRTAMMNFPEATMSDSGGPRIAPAATERLKRLYRLGFLKERWWL